MKKISLLLTLASALVTSSALAADRLVAYQCTDTSNPNYVLILGINLSKGKVQVEFINRGISVTEQLSAVKLKQGTKEHSYQITASIENSGTSLFFNMSPSKALTGNLVSVLTAKYKNSAGRTNISRSNCELLKRAL